jgi:hypothetical protein
MIPWLLNHKMFFTEVMAESRHVTVAYLAEIAGVKEETVWRDVAELLAMIREGTLE